MDIRPWIALVVLLGLAALLLAGLAVSLVSRSRPATAPAEDAAQDDLPGFLESPPGTSAATPTAGGSFVALAAPPAPPPPAPEPSPSGRSHALIAAGAAVLVAGAAVLIAVWAPGGGADRRPPDSGPPRDVQARLTFAGVVLEQRAVGVTVTYPEVKVTGSRNDATARLTLPTWNCMTVEAPDEPAEAGCVPGRTEYAELAGPALSMSRGDGTLRFSGDFATSTRPTGSPPEATGRVYSIAVDVTPEAGARSGRWRPATAVLHLADRETASVEGEMRVRD